MFVRKKRTLRGTVLLGMGNSGLLGFSVFPLISGEAPAELNYSQNNGPGLSRSTACQTILNAALRCQYSTQR